MSNYASCKKCWPGPTFAKLSFKDSAIIQSGGAATIRVSVLGGGISFPCQPRIFCDDHAYGHGL